MNPRTAQAAPPVLAKSMAGGEIIARALEAHAKPEGERT